MPDDTTYGDIILDVLQEQTDRDNALNHEQVLLQCELRGLQVDNYDQGLRTVSSYLSAMAGSAQSWRDNPYFNNPHVKRKKLVDFLGKSQLYYWYEKGNK